MATYNLTKQVTNPASSSTQNVSSGDTINFTITIPAGTADTTPEVYANPTNCTLSNASDTSSPFTFTATSFSSSTYSVQFSFVDTDSNTTSYSHTVSGNVAASLTAPTIGSVTTNNPASPNVTATVNLSSNGSGGTLEYAQTTTNSIPSTGWQTSNQFTHPRPTAAAGTAVTRYYWASRNRNTSASSSSVSKAVGYFTGDPSATVSSISPSSPLAHDYTGSVDVVITGGSAGTRYRVLNTTTNAGMGNTGDGNGTVTITNTGTRLPTAGNTSNYKLQYKVLESNGGNDIFSDVSPSETFSISRDAAPATGSFNLSTGTITEGGSLTVQNISTSPSGGYHLKVFRNSGDSPDSISPVTKTWTGTSTANFTMSVANQSASEIGYQGESFTWLLREGTDTSAGWNSGASLDSADFTLYDDEHGTSVSNSSISIGATATSFTVGVVSNWSGSNTVAARIRNTSTNTVVQTFNITTNSGTTNVSVSSGLPSAGNTSNYRVEVYNGNAYLNGATFTVTKAISPPVISSVTNNNAASANVTATVNLSSSGAGGTLKYAQTTTNAVPSTGWQTGNTFSHPRNTTRYYWASRDENTSGAFDSEAHAVGYIAKDTKVDLSPTAVTLAHDANSDITITLTNGTPGNEYQLRLGNANISTLLLSGSSTSGTLTIATGSHPTVGNSNTYNLYGRRTDDSGGDDTYALLDDTVVVTRNSESVSAPTDITFSADPGTFSETVSIAATASGGSGGTLKVSDDNNNWDTNGTSYTFTRGTAKTIYARREGVGANSASYPEEHTVNRLSTDTSITVSPTSATVAPNANTTVNINISNATQQHTYHVYKQTGTNTYQGINVNTGTLSGSTGSVTIPNSQLPSAGNSITYRFYGILPSSSGGLGVQQITNGTFTISRTAEDVTPNAFTFTDVSNVSRSTTQTSNTITVAGLSTGTSVVVSIIGGTYSKNSGSYTSSTGTASNGDTFSVRHTSSSGFLTNTDTQLTIGGISDTFRSTTLAQDTTPNNYTFDNATDAGVSTLVLSNVQTITGITGNVSVSVSGQGTPKISINGGTFVSSGTIQNNQTLQVRLTSSASNSTSHTATVTLGTGTYAQETFVVTTVAASGGTGGGVGGGSSDYGIEIYDTDGVTKVLSPTTRYAVRVTAVTTFDFKASGTANDSVLLQTDMTDLSTSNSDVLFLPGSLVLEVTRESNGFRITNISSGELTRTMFGIRF